MKELKVQISIANRAMQDPNIAGNELAINWWRGYKAAIEYALEYIPSANHKCCACCQYKYEHLTLKSCPICGRKIE